MSNEAVNDVAKSTETDDQFKEAVDILIKTNQTILALVKELRKQVVACQEETSQLKEDLQWLCSLVIEGLSVDASTKTVDDNDDLDMYVSNSRRDKDLN